MTEEISTDEIADKRIMKIIKIVLCVLALIAVFCFGYYFFNGARPQTTLAQFGDFFGGTLNPILGFLTVGLLVWSIQVQMRELKLTRIELSETTAEANLSRKAMEDQMKHLENEAQLSELQRLLSEQMLRCDTLFSKKLSPELVSMIYPPNAITLPVSSPISYREFLFPNSQLKVDLDEQSAQINVFLNEENIYMGGKRASTKNNQDDISILKQLEHRFIFIARLIDQYSQINSSTTFKDIYYDEALVLIESIEDFSLFEYSEELKGYGEQFRDYLNV